MKGQINTALKFSAVLLASAAFALAQPNGLSNSENSAAPGQPGSINYVEGEATLNGQSLSAQSIGAAVLKPGQTLATGDGYVEVLLTPGAFLRLGHNAEIRLGSAGLAGAQIDLIHGAAMLEADQLIEGTNLSMVIGGTTARVEKTGLYKFDTGAQVIQTLDGKLDVSFNGKSTTLGKHDQVLLASDKPLKKHGFDENTVKLEPLYVWSRARSEDEAQANLSAASNGNTYVATGPGWYWDPYLSAYGFWPLAGSAWGPFGWGFYSPAYFGFGYGGGYPYYYAPGWRYRQRGGHRWRGQPGVAARVPIHRGWRGSTVRPGPRMAAPHVQPHFSAPRMSAPSGRFSAPRSR